jgi:hypothetical protein
LERPVPCGRRSNGAAKRRDSSENRLALLLILLPAGLVAACQVGKAAIAAPFIFVAIAIGGIAIALHLRSLLQMSAGA